MSLTGSSNMTRPSLSGKRTVTGPASAVHDQAMDPVFDRVSYQNEGNPTPGGSDRQPGENDQAEEEPPPMFEVAESGLDRDMVLLYRGTGEREMRFLVPRIRRHRGVTTLLPIGRASSGSAGENSPFMQRYIEGGLLAAVRKGDEFQNRM